MALLAAGLVPFIAVFGRLERAGGRAAALPAWRLVIGSLLVCAGLALIALDGIGADGPLGIRWAVVLSALVGAALAGVRVLPRPDRA
jgi:hypothetical protein